MVVTVIGLCFGGDQTMLGASVTIIALATLWLMKYVEAVVLLGRRGEISLMLSPEGPEKNAVLALLAERGFHMRSRRIELLPDASTNLTCSAATEDPTRGGRRNWYAI